MEAKIGRADASFRRHQIGFSCNSCRIGGLVASCWKIQVRTHASNPLTANSLSLGNAELVSRQGRSYMQIRRCLCIHKILQKPLLENRPSAPVEEAFRYRFSNRHPQTETIGSGLGYRVIQPVPLRLPRWRKRAISLVLVGISNRYQRVFNVYPKFLFLFILFILWELLCVPDRAIQYYTYTSISRIRIQRIFEIN